MYERLKRQDLRKMFVLGWNVFRMSMMKLVKGKHVRLSLIQNINIDTVLKVKNGYLQLSHSVFTRKNVALCAEGGELIIGTSFFNQGCYVTSKKKIVIGDNCLFGPNVVIVDHDHDYHCSNEQRGVEYILDDIFIGNNVVVGANTVILKGTRIGDNCMIGAGTVVSGEIPSGTIYYTKKTNCMRPILFKG